MEVILMYVQITLLVNFVGMAFIAVMLDIIYEQTIVRDKRQRIVMRVIATFIGLLFILFSFLSFVLIAGG